MQLYSGIHDGQCMLTASERQAPAGANADHRMIDTLSIDNYKCFQKVRLKDLRRFNIIVGRNAGGKTALLEALYLLASATTQNSLKLRAFRGMGAEIQVSNERAGFEALWRDLFFGFDQKSTIEIAATGSDKNTRSLSVAYGDVENVMLPFTSSSVGLRRRGGVRHSQARRSLSRAWTAHNRPRSGRPVPMRPPVFAVAHPHDFTRSRRVKLLAREIHPPRARG